MVKLCIQPEEKDLNKYLRLADRNNFQVEIGIGLLKSNIKLFESRVFGVHGSNNLSSSELGRELEMLDGFNILYVVYHDSVIKKLSDSFEHFNKHKITILMENYNYQGTKEFNELYSRSKLKIKNLKKCIDTGHVNLSSDKDLNKWVDKEVELFYINNNYGKDTHNSLYDGEINFLSIKRLLKNRYISLEVNRGFKAYLKNIQYMIKNRIAPFERTAIILNHPIVQEEFTGRVCALLRKNFKNSLCYAFFYGSFVKSELNPKSDVDMVIILKSKKLKTDIFYNSYKNLCSDYNIRLDSEYPFEIFLENDYLTYTRLNNRLASKKDIADRGEFLFSFLDRYIFITGKMKEFQTHRKVVEKVVLGPKMKDKSYLSKSDLKSIVRNYVNNS